MTTATVYPVHVDAALDPHLSRWLWLVKWVLVIPHYLVLAFLWVGFVVTSVIAFVAILVTGKYPRGLFTYNVGVLRWSWRVSYYAYGALGTDRYPPFTLDEVEDYPAHLSVDYPAELSRGLVLVKSWLLALPHYVIVAVFVGGTAWVGMRDDQGAAWNLGGGGLVGLLVLIAAIVLAVTGGYPRGLFDLVLGMNRWTLRVAAYAALMTDVYPPFRLDLGGSDPAGVDLRTPPTAPAASEPAVSGPEPLRGTVRVVPLVIGSVLAVLALGLLVGGGRLVAADRGDRDAQGFLTSTAVSASTDGYAITSSLDLSQEQLGDVDLPNRLIGDTRVRVTSDDPARAVFVGIAPTAAAQAWLADVARTVVTVDGDGLPGTAVSGAAPSSSAAAQSFWAAQASGIGKQSVTWTPTSGDWTLVVMNADSSASLSVRTDAAATVPALPWLAGGALVAGFLLLAGGGLLVAVAVRPRHG